MPIVIVFSRVWGVLGNFFEISKKALFDNKLFFVLVGVFFMLFVILVFFNVFGVWVLEGLG